MDAAFVNAGADEDAPDQGADPSPPPATAIAKPSKSIAYRYMDSGLS